MITFNYNPRTEKIIVLFPYDPSTAMEVKELGAYAQYEITPTKTFNGVENVKKFKHWQMDLAAEVIENLNKIKGDKKYQVDSLIFAAWETKREFYLYNYDLSKSIESNLILQSTWAHLQNKIPGFQMAAVEYIRRNPRGVMLADEDFLDPKLETLLAIETGEMYPVLILCPIEKKFTWASKIKKHFPHQPFEILDENKNGVDELTKICIVAYHQVNGVMDILKSITWRVLVCDDYRHINDLSEAKTRTVIELAQDIPLKMILSNGLDLSRPEKLIAALKITDRLSEFGGFIPFVNRYCQPKKNTYGWDYSGASNLEELERRLRARLVIARKKADIIHLLPVKPELPT